MTIRVGTTAWLAGGDRNPNLGDMDDAPEPQPAPPPPPPPKEIGGPAGPEPTRYGDWEQKGRCTDF